MRVTHAKSGVTFMPTNLDIRPYAADDETQVLSVWNEAMWADPIDATTWRSRYLLDQNFSPDSCLVAVAAAAGSVEGFVLGMTDTNASPSNDAWVIGFGVRESRRREGIGAALMATLEATWRPAGVGTIHYGPYIPSYVAPGIDVAAYADAVLFLNAIGARELGRPVSMKASLTGYRRHEDIDRLRSKHTDSGILVRPAEPVDIVPLLEFLKRHFPHWRNDAISVLRDLFAGDPQSVTMLVAEANGVIIGYAQTRNERFGPFGVNEEYRGQGVGAVLLSETLVVMRAHGFHSAWFLWTSDRTARLYQQHGFEQARRFAMMDKTLNTNES